MFKSLRVVACVIVGAALLSACYGSGTGGTVTPSPDDKAKTDLTNALNAENQYYSSYSIYSADVSTMKAIAPNLDWGGALKVITVTNVNASDTVCLSEESTAGTWFAIGEIAPVTSGAGSPGTYYTSNPTYNPCVPGMSPATINLWPKSW